MTKKEKRHLYYLRYKEKHREELKKRNRENMKKYYYRNPEKFRAHSRAYIKSHPEKIKEKYYKNREALCKNSREYRNRHPEKVKERFKHWRLKNKEYQALRLREWRIKNKEKIIETNNAWKRKNRDRLRKSYKRAYEKRKQKTETALNIKMSSAIRDALSKRGARKSNSWEQAVGYTAKELKEHLERNFKKGMDWKNRSQWHIDHIIPLSLWNYDSEEDPEFKAAWALANLRPLWKEENLKKRNKLPSLEDLKEVVLLVERADGDKSSEDDE